MKIKKVIIHNFYSYKHTEVDLLSFNGITLVKGKNKDTGGSNGAGKSAFFEAIIWGLTGKTVRKGIEDAIVNNQSKEDCYVEIFVDNLQIKRTKRPSKLQLFLNGVEVTKINQKETQAHIEKLCNFTYKSLVSTMIYGQNAFTEFLGASIEEKRQIMKTFLDMEYIFDYRQKATNEKLGISGEIKANEVLKSKLEKELQSLKENTFTEPIPPAYDIEDINKRESIAHEYQQKINEIVREQEKIKNILASLSNEFKIQVNDLCDRCGQVLTQDAVDLVEKKNQEIATTQIALFNELKKEKGYYEDLLSKIEIPISSSALASQIKRYQTFSDKEKMQFLVSEKENQLNEVKQAIQDLTIKLECYKFWELGFSEKGLIRYLIRNILTKINTIANHYLNILTEGKFSIYFDDQLKESLFHNNESIHYISLSGGEKNRVDLAVMMALNQIPSLLNNTSINLLLFDEIGGFLDESGVKNLYILLKELKETQNIFVITHNAHLEELLSDSSSMTIEKYKGISKIIS